MRYCRFRLGRRVHHGLIETVDDREMISVMLGVPPHDTDPIGTIIPNFIPPDRVPLAEAELLAPVHPHKIICVGRNYSEHAAELGNEVPTEPLLFLKPPSSVVGPGDNIVLPRVSERVDYEGELGIVIKKTCRNIRDGQDVTPFIFGYTCVNDVTARDLQKKDNQWTRAKGFDTFCPVGPIISDEINPATGVEVQTLVNGEPRQHGNTKDFIFSVEKVVRYISRIMTLFPFDLIATGTPSGVGPLKQGDVVAVKIEGIGTLTNHVVKD